jgi:hypothetical protein
VIDLDERSRFAWQQGRSYRFPLSSRVLQIFGPTPALTKFLERNKCAHAFVKTSGHFVPRISYFVPRALDEFGF